ncbi:N-formylglutamate amidohydrolase [Rhodospira trueperi]|uniref:N-formylglutamate amidohydrolase n=1 Tax=Rhodospira trueperi TaxID=69960 RepID=A0A1G7F250_9PROT|nr:N-formylglutamate amidohydrolase [Rhodospira trueperi]SDE69816.1 N-formylglutamate amidohydrolase [Rhodospira trueperi]
MSRREQEAFESEDLLKLIRPERWTRPLVLASPHSGTRYPSDFLAVSRLSTSELRASEDTHVDAIFAAAPSLGVPLLCALFPRVYLDVNREPLELDPGMFSDPLPAHANPESTRVRAGLGTLPRIAGDGQHIYRRKLPFSEAARRLTRCYHPYHTALAGLLRETRRRFGHCILLDCHSMPSTAVEGGRDGKPDVVLGDRHGTACDATITDAAEAALTAHGLRVRRNKPYAGGFTTSHYGCPAEGTHALQIEFNRALYMDERTREPTAGLERLARAVPLLLRAVSETCGMSQAAE